MATPAAVLNPYAFLYPPVPLSGAQNLQYQLQRLTRNKANVTALGSGFLLPGAAPLAVGVQQIYGAMLGPIDVILCSFDCNSDPCLAVLLASLNDSLEIAISTSATQTVATLNPILASLSAFAAAVYKPSKVEVVSSSSYNPINCQNNIPPSYLRNGPQ